MKKIISLILAVVMLLSFTACTGEKTEKETGATENAESQSPVNAEENLLTVTVNLAASLFEGKTEDEIKADAKENGISKCVINKDGSVTYTMSKSKHKELLKDLEEGIEESCESFINGENKVDSFLEIKTNDDFSEFNIVIDSDKYTMMDSMNAMSFYILGIYYQCFAGGNFDEVDVVLNFIDSDTQEIISTSSYRKLADNLAASEN